MEVHQQAVLKLKFMKFRMIKFILEKIKPNYKIKYLKTKIKHIFAIFKLFCYYNILFLSK